MGAEPAGLSTSREAWSTSISSPAAKSSLTRDAAAKSSLTRDKKKSAGLLNWWVEREGREAQSKREEMAQNSGRAGVER